MQMSGPSTDYSQGEAVVLPERASLLARLKFRSFSRWGLVIDAAGVQASDGQWPRLGVMIGDTAIATLTINRGGSTRYWLNFLTEPGLADIRLTLVNGRPGMPRPTLTITRLEIVPL